MTDKNLTHYLAATAIPVNDKNEFLIVKRAEWEKAFPNQWTVPGGKLKVEDWINTEKTTDHFWYNIIDAVVHREVKEETNLELKDLGYVTNMVYIHPDNVPCIVISYYGYTKPGEIKLENSLTDYAWVNLETAKEYDLIGGIYDELVILDDILNK